VGDVVEIRCACGYHTRDLAAGGLFSGLAELFTCRTCVAVVSALVWGSGYDEDLDGELKPTCPDCNGDDLVDPVDERLDGDVERAGELDHGGQPRVAAGSFEQRDLGAVQAAGVSECLLAQAGGVSALAEVRREALAWLHRGHALPSQTNRLQTKTLTSVSVLSCPRKTCLGWR
jgi:hypothetical protein